MLEILRRCNRLGCIGRYVWKRTNGDETMTVEDYDNTISILSKLGHSMSLNRARARVLLRQSVPLALWSMILVIAPKAFRGDAQYHDGIVRYDGSMYDGTFLAGITERPDAIYHLIRERVVGEMMINSFHRRDDAS